AAKALFALIVITYIVLISNADSRRNSCVHQSTSHAINYLRSTSRSFSSSPILTLISRRNFWGTPTSIEFPNYTTFNPSMLSLPILPRSNATLLVVAADEYDWIEIDEDTEVQPRNLIASLLSDKHEQQFRE